MSFREVEAVDGGGMPEAFDPEINQEGIIRFSICTLFLLSREALAADVCGGGRWLHCFIRGLSGSSS